MGCVRRRGRLAFVGVSLLAVALSARVALGQGQPPQSKPILDLPLYDALTQFDLKGGAAQADGLVLQRDRVKITFNGTFYFESPIEGRIRGAVFIGQGEVVANPPDDTFERVNVQRMIKADRVESTFKTAVLRFSDDTVDALGLKPNPIQTVPQEAHDLAIRFPRRLLRETGANVNARIVVSILNHESPGFFSAEFDGGSRGRFGFVLDYQARIPEAHFGLDGGEKGFFFAYDDVIFQPDVWMAFLSLREYQTGTRDYSDAHAIIDIKGYDMDINLRDGRTMRLQARMNITALADGLRAIPLVLNEDLTTYFNQRRDRSLRVRSARLGNGEPIVAIQESWDGSVTLVLPEPIAKGQQLEAVVDMKGEYLLGYELQEIPIRPRARSWYPREVPLEPSIFDLTFHHDKGTLVDSIGTIVRQEPSGEGGVLTEWRMDQPVRRVGFTAGYFKLKTDTTKIENGNSVGLDYYKQRDAADPTSPFVLSELGNGVRYFTTLFGPYPYSRISAINVSTPYTENFPTILILPRVYDSASSRSGYLFRGREISHQWWGNFIPWRSYRDEWLDEGLAQYSGLLYTGVRDSDSDEEYLISWMYYELLSPPRTLTGEGGGRLADIGPIIMGRRLSTRESLGAWDALVRDKGALVLRMLNFLFSDPSTGDDRAFFDMMKDFVRQYANKYATTEDFIAAANAHFPDTPIARQFHLTDLDWFFEQWIFETPFPSYGLSYSLSQNADGSATLKGILTQRNAPDEWKMVLPITTTFDHGKQATFVAMVFGAKTSIRLDLPAMPHKVALDPGGFILSAKTTTSKLHNQQ